MAISKIYELTDGTKYLIYRCPACNQLEYIPYQGGTEHKGPVWKFNGNLESPSLQPSVRHFVPDEKGRVKETICHYYLTNGHINYCTDSPHAFRGQTVPIPQLTSDEP